MSVCAFRSFSSSDCVWIAVSTFRWRIWLWGGGWLANLGSLDFAGGAVIHISAGVSALVMAIMIGPRNGYGHDRDDTEPFAVFLLRGRVHVGRLVRLSTGAAPVSMTVVTSAFVAIQLSCVAAALTWMAAEWLQRDKPTALGMSGAVAGLVAIALGGRLCEPVVCAGDRHRSGRALLHGRQLRQAHSGL